MSPKTNGARVATRAAATYSIAPLIATTNKAVSTYAHSTPTVNPPA
jgi:hypothetical protein